MVQSGEEGGDEDLEYNKISTLNVGVVTCGRKQQRLTPAVASHYLTYNMYCTQRVSGKHSCFEQS